jgi:hypothetical protein
MQPLRVGLPRGLRGIVDKRRALACASCAGLLDVERCDDLGALDRVALCAQCGEDAVIAQKTVH